MKYGKQYVEYEAYLMATVQNFDNFYCNIIIANVYDFVLLGKKKSKRNQRRCDSKKLLCTMHCSTSVTSCEKYILIVNK